MLKNIRIGVKLIVVGTLIMVIPLLVVAVMAITKSTQGLSAVETEQLARGARLIAEQVDGVFQEEKKLAVEGALDPNIVAAAIAANERSVPGQASSEKASSPQATDRSGSSSTISARTVAAAVAAEKAAVERAASEAQN
ncbi:MAG TPA: hypothetical protein VMV03_14925, partial [Spirochaetia bacterium]|nr:hypothetical protein [Spirochaetia bacterium]